ncbi:adenylate/guanylate cyclase domain-containing protein [Pantanalinema sp. GBBB05]|uniref:adenylate/guanylate cyclase domain-containing protein n=1 Tax=Pantanalinema sp. GBBB05 TaxID=2604139 RepID=UPI003D81311C
MFGDSVNLAARIESVTPAGETYLSQAAWLALNKAEVSTEFVDSFSLKGMSEPEKVYRINQ